MTRTEFLLALSRGLAGLPPAEIEDILDDYEAHFAEAARAGRSEAEVVRALGDPMRLAKELRAESGLRRWERERSPRSLAAALIALLGLAAVDFLVLLPLLFWLGLMTLILGLVLVAFCLAGLALLVSAQSLNPFAHIVGSLTRALLGIGFLAGGVGGGALLFLMLEWIMRLLGKYARLHYRLLSPENDTAPGS